MLERQRQRHLVMWVRAMVISAGTPGGADQADVLPADLESEVPRVTRAAFYRWFDAPLERFMEALAQQALAYARAQPVALPGPLRAHRQRRGSRVAARRQAAVVPPCAEGMGGMCCHAGQETARAAQPSSALTMLPACCSAAPLAAARQPGVVQRPANLTGHRWLALVTFGVGGMPRRRGRHGPRPARPGVSRSRGRLKRLLHACPHARGPCFPHGVATQVSSAPQVKPCMRQTA